MIVKHQPRDPVIVQVIVHVLLDGAREDPVKIQGGGDPGRIQLVLLLELPMFHLLLRKHDAVLLKIGVRG